MRTQKSERLLAVSRLHHEQESKRAPPVPDVLSIAVPPQHLNVALGNPWNKAQRLGKEERHCERMVVYDDVVIGSR